MLGGATDLGPPQVLFADETLDQALRQLLLYGRFGLPVLSPDEKHLEDGSRAAMSCTL